MKIQSFQSRGLRQLSCGADRVIFESEHFAQLFVQPRARPLDHGRTPEREPFVRYVSQG